VLRAPRAGGQLGRDREGRLAGRLGIVVAEVVEQLLDAHGVLRRELALHQEATDVGVGGRVHVDREGGERVLRRGQEGVVLDPVVRLGVEAGARAVDLRFAVGVLSTERGEPADDPAHDSALHAALDGGYESAGERAGDPQRLLLREIRPCWRGGMPLGFDRRRRECGGLHGGGGGGDRGRSQRGRG
jgi:hypothetical protein